MLNYKCLQDSGQMIRTQQQPQTRNGYIKIDLKYKNFIYRQQFKVSRPGKPKTAMYPIWFKSANTLEEQKNIIFKLDLLPTRGSTTF